MEYLRSILINNFVVYTVNLSSQEGRENVLKLNLNTKKSSMYALYQGSDKLNVLNKLDAPFNMNSFAEFVVYLLELQEKITKKEEKFDKNSGKNKKKESFSNDVDPDLLTQAELIEHQKMQLKLLEQEEESKRKKVEDDKIKKEQQEKERNEKEKQDKKLKEEKLNSLPPEPTSDNSDSTLIIFRYPHSEQRRERRFMKTDKIQVLYNFVAALGNDMFEESNEFDLITPFPMKIYSDMERTLEEEKLYPNAVLQIREI